MNASELRTEAEGYDPYSELDRTPTVEHGAEALRDIRAAIIALRLAEEVLTDFLADTMAGGQAEVEGVGFCQVRRGSTRVQWDHDALTGALYASMDGMHLWADADGELLHPGEAARNGMALILALANPAWRVTRLREHGIDPDEYSQRTPGKLSIQIT